MGTLKFKLTIAYDGTAYHGWQSQKSGRGVQDKCEAALAILFPSHPKLESSSRTDTGVHALGMVAHFEIPAVELKMPLRHLILAVNACLPRDVRVVSVEEADPEFHARFDALGKQYRYHVWNHVSGNPLLANQAWHVAGDLDLIAMRSACASLVGRLDFRSLTANRGDVLEDSIRTVSRCEIKKTGPSITFIIEGEGFLYKMCRGIVGTLVQIGQGKCSDDIETILNAKDRRSAGMTAPAHGLVLQKVFYPETEALRKSGGPTEDEG